MSIAIKIGDISQIFGNISQIKHIDLLYFA